MQTLLKSAAAGLFLSSALALPAQAVDMAHDKDFWRDGINAMSEMCNFEQTAYTTDQYKAFLQTSMNAGNPPEIFTWWTGNALNDLVESGLAANVDELWDAKIASGEFSEANRGLFMVDGQTYAIPLLLARWVMFYNIELFDAHGVEVPNSWEELESAAAKLKAAGVTPFQATVQDGWRGFIWFSEIMIRQNPEAFMGLHDGSVPYDGPEVQKVFETWVDWYAKGYFSDPRSNSEVEEFSSGQSAMYLMGEWATGLLEENGMTVGQNVSAFITPSVDTSKAPFVIMEGAPILISEEAWAEPKSRAVFECWASLDGSNKWAEVQSLFNGNQKATAPNQIIQTISDEISEEGHLAMSRWWEAVPSDLQGDLVAEMSAFMLDPTAEKAEEVMENMQALNEAYWTDQF